MLNSIKNRPYYKHIIKKYSNRAGFHRNWIYVVQPAALSICSLSLPRESSEGGSCAFSSHTPEPRACSTQPALQRDWLQTDPPTATPPPPSAHTLTFPPFISNTHIYPAIEKMIWAQEQHVITRWLLQPITYLVSFFLVSSVNEHGTLFQRNVSSFSPIEGNCNISLDVKLVCGVSVPDSAHLPSTLTSSCRLMQLKISLTRSYKQPASKIRAQDWTTPLNCLKTEQV